MAVSQEYLEFIQEQLRELGTVSIRKMFGGAGVYYRGLFFALIDNDAFYLKVDDSNRADFESDGMSPFCPFPDKPDYTMGYYEVPSEIIENPDELSLWAKKAVAVAKAAANKKMPKTAAKSKSVAKIKSKTAK